MEKRNYTFQEIAKQWTRYCNKAFLCEECKLHNICGTYPWSVTEENWQFVEREVMEWAKQNPEPVYPTWEEWLQSIGVMESVQSTKERCQRILLVDGIVAHAIPTTKVVEPIPADIAEKLEIKPKVV